MKIRYYFMSAVMASAALTGFTSCSDDDDDVAPVQKSELSVADGVHRVKIGADTRLPIADVILSGNGDYDAYSLNPDIAQVVVGEDGQRYIEALKNGVADIVITDGANLYKRVSIMSFTTDEMQLSHSTVAVSANMGTYTSNQECAVVAGNGQYTIESDDSHVTAAIDPETGEISFSAKAGAEPYAATLTVSDVCGLTASFTVEMTPTFDAFSQAELENILNSTNHAIAYNGSTLNYFNYFLRGYNGYGSMVNENADGMTTIGYYRSSYSSWYGNQEWATEIRYPSTLATGVEATGYVLYGNGARNGLTPEEGKVKLLEDNADRTVVIWWNIDLENEKIENAYVVWYKNR